MMYFLEGLPKSGKTYEMVRMIIQSVKNGINVASTITVDAEGIYALIKKDRSLLGKIYKIERLSDTENFTHGTIFIDEAWRIFDSYKGTDTSLETRNLALVTRHKYRTINVIAQRPTSVQVTIRGNINRYYKCVKTARWPWPRFARYEFQEMTGETVNESVEPVSVKHYWGKKKVFDSYNSYFYGDLEPLHGLKFDLWYLTYKENVVAFYLYFARRYRVIHSFLLNETCNFLKKG